MNRALAAILEGSGQPRDKIHIRRTFDTSQKDVTEPGADGAKIGREGAGNLAASGNHYIGSLKHAAKRCQPKNDEQRDVDTCVVTNMLTEPSPHEHFSACDLFSSVIAFHLVPGVRERNILFHSATDTVFLHISVLVRLFSPLGLNCLQM